MHIPWLLNHSLNASLQKYNISFLRSMSVDSDICNDSRFAAFHARGCREYQLRLTLSLHSPWVTPEFSDYYLLTVPCVVIISVAFSFNRLDIHYYSYSIIKWLWLMYDESIHQMSIFRVAWWSSISHFVFVPRLPLPSVGPVLPPSMWLSLYCWQNVRSVEVSSFHSSSAKAGVF